MKDASTPRLGRVTQLSPLEVQLNGETTAAPVSALSDFSTATAGTTEALVVTVEGRRLAWRVL